MTTNQLTPEDRELLARPLFGFLTVTARLAERYWDRESPAREEALGQMLAQEHVRVVLHPDKVSRLAV